MKKIENIFVATDFSDTARNAFHYAKRLAVTLEATITVVHITEYFMPDSAIDISHIPDLEVKRLTTDAMATFIKEGDKADEWTMVKHKVESLIIKGNAIDRLVELSKQGATDLIVMGTTGLEDFITKIIGTTSHEVANNAHCPVLLVPRDAAWHKIENMMYASNFESIVPKMLEEVTDFAQAVHADIQYVHVEDFSFDEDNNVNKRILNNFYLAKSPNTPIKVHAMYNTDKIEALKAYSEENNIHLMAFVSEHRNFWENLMHKSVTANLAIASHIPMLVMHFDD